MISLRPTREPVSGSRRPVLRLELRCALFDNAAAAVWRCLADVLVFVLFVCCVCPSRDKGVLILSFRLHTSASGLAAAATSFVLPVSALLACSSLDFSVAFP
eukprot:m.468321 g.468321  ORF g.468321 m.468321 type:complete len:102 (+) comp57073_c0_seq1:938-1243(+)